MPHVVCDISVVSKISDLSVLPILTDALTIHLNVHKIRQALYQIIATCRSILTLYFPVKHFKIKQTCFLFFLVFATGLYISYFRKQAIFSSVMFVLIIVWKKFVTYKAQTAVSICRYISEHWLLFILLLCIYIYIPTCSYKTKFMNKMNLVQCIVSDTQ